MQVYTLPQPTIFEGRLARLLGENTKLSDWKIFANGENFVQVKNPHSEVAVIGRAEPPGDNFFQTSLLIDTLRRSGAKKIIVYLPYFAYSRQDRQLSAGESVAASYITGALWAAGATQIITLELHSELTATRSPVPLRNFSFMPMFASAIAGRIGRTIYTIASPDRGGLKRAQLFARELKYRDEVVWIEKIRAKKKGSPRALKIHGKLRGETAVMADDMLDTGGTIARAVKILREQGIKKFYLCVTHPIFSRNAAELIASLKFEQIFTTNTLPLSESVRRACRIKVLDAARRLVGAIKQPRPRERHQVSRPSLGAAK